MSNNWFEMQLLYTSSHNLKTICTFFSAFLWFTFRWPSSCPCSLSQLLTKYRGTSTFMFHLQTSTDYISSLQTPFRMSNSDSIQELRTNWFKLSHNSVIWEWMILLQSRKICAIICMFIFVWLFHKMRENWNMKVHWYKW